MDVYQHPYLRRDAAINCGILHLCAGGLFIILPGDMRMDPVHVLFMVTQCQAGIPDALPMDRTGVAAWLVI